MPNLSSTIVFRTPADAGLRALLTIAGRAQQDMIGRLWEAETFDVLHGGVDPGGRPLPRQGYVVAARMGWHPTYPDGDYVPSRVTRMVAHRVVSVLRTMTVRDRALTRGEGPAAYVRGTQRQRARYLRANPRIDVETLRLCDIQPAPNLRPLVNLGAVDRNFAMIDVDNSRITLHLRTPTSEHPVSRADWPWRTMMFDLPAHLVGRAVSKVSLPTLTLDGDSVVVRFCLVESVPEPVAPADMTVLVGIDWSPSCLAVSSVVERTGTGLVSGYEGYRYDDRGLGVKNDRLRGEMQQVYAKADRLEALAQNADDQTQNRLLADVERLREHGRVLGAKRRRINRELAFHAARTLVDHAVAVGAHGFAVEDLSTYESGERGRRVNTVTSQSARAQTYAALRHTSARAGLDVIDVPAKGTSAHCPECDGDLARPDGYHSGACAACGLSGNRDALAAVNVAKRVLAAPRSVKRRKDRTKRVTKITHVPVTRCRDKSRPTPARPKHKRVRHSVEAKPFSTPASKRRRGARPSVRTFEPPRTRVYPSPALGTLGDECRLVPGMGRRFMGAW